MEFKLIKSVALTSGLLMAAPAAFAGHYGGVAVSFTELDDIRNLNTVELRLGTHLHQNIAIEARGLVGVGSTGAVEPGLGIAAYLKPRINLTDRVNAYALAGYSTQEYDDGTQDIDVDGLVYGAGLGFKVNDAYCITAEYTTGDLQADDDDVDSNILTFGISKHF